MSPRTKKAALTAAMIYFSVTGLALGMLRTAQQTRRTLYGGQPVLAQYNGGAPADSVTLGGGEWEVSLPMPELGAEAESLSEKLPPCAAKCVLRLVVLCESWSEQIADDLSI